MADKKNLCAQIDIALHNRVWEQMAADGLLTKEELARAKQLSAERYLPRTVWE